MDFTKDVNSVNNGIRSPRRWYLWSTWWMYVCMEEKRLVKVYVCKIKCIDNFVLLPLLGSWSVLWTFFFSFSEINVFFSEIDIQLFLLFYFKRHCSFSSFMFYCYRVTEIFKLIIERPFNNNFIILLFSLSNLQFHSVRLCGRRSTEL